MGEVIQFPNQGPVQPQDLQEGMEQQQSIQIEMVDEFMEVYVPMIFQSAYNNGFDLCKVQNNEVNKLFVESFRAALFKSMNIPHYLQEVAEKSIEIHRAETETEQDN